MKKWSASICFLFASMVGLSGVFATSGNSLILNKREKAEKAEDLVVEWILVNLQQSPVAPDAF